MVANTPYYGRLRVLIWACAIFGFFSIPAILHAELLNYFGSAMSGWHNTVAVSGGVGSSLVNATVEYAVYSPGVFDQVFGGGDPSHGTQYVYCYQVFDASTSKKAVSKYNVGLGTGIIGARAMGIGELSDPYVPSKPGTASNTSVLVYANPLYTSATWTLSSPNIPIGGKSDILFFASPAAPNLEPSTVYGGASVASGSVASPIPEPSTLLSLMIAAGFYIFVRRIWSAS